MLTPVQNLVQRRARKQRRHAAQPEAPPPPASPALCFASGDDLPRRLAPSAASLWNVATGLRLNISSAPPLTTRRAPPKRLGSPTEALVLGAAAAAGAPVFGVPRQGYQRALK